MIQTIYMLWFQGFEHAPELVKSCVQSWKHYNPDWDIVLLDNTNLRNYIEVEDYPEMEMSHRSDIVRMKLLHQYGGVWADVTTFCHRPLRDWLPRYASEGFFVFDRPYSNLLMSNWFIYAEPSNLLFHEWYLETMHYYKDRVKAHTYFIHHQLFEKVYLSHKEYWDQIPKLSATLPHSLLSIEGIPNAHADIDSKRVPLYKFSHRVKYANNPDSNLSYLFRTLKPCITPQ